MTSPKLTHGAPVPLENMVMRSKTTTVPNPDGIM
jgi:hypothetical protein